MSTYRLMSRDLYYLCARPYSYVHMINIADNYL
jgi:hypothetical protein